MAATTLSDIIVPELFTPYVIQRTKDLSAFFQSGIVERRADFDALASEAAPIHNMPFWEDLTGDAAPIIEGTALTAVGIGSKKDVSTTIRRAQMWGATDLAAAISGSDPMQAIGDLVARYWSRELQKELIAILGGVFGSYEDANERTVTPFASHILDISTEVSADDQVISAAAFIDALELMGDAQDALTTCVMDSATKAYLRKLNLIETEHPSADTDFDTFQGRRTIVDDGCPVDASNVHTLFIFGRGAVAYGEGNPVGNVPTEVARDAKMGSGIDYLINRRTFILHPRGVAWTNANRTNVETPTRTELANAENWLPAFEDKAIPLVALKYKLG